MNRSSFVWSLFCFCALTSPIYSSLQPLGVQFCSQICTLSFGLGTEFTSCFPTAVVERETTPLFLLFGGGMVSDSRLYVAGCLACTIGSVSVELGCMLSSFPLYFFFLLFSVGK